jgi:hypothetical protein
VGDQLSFTGPDPLAGFIDWTRKNPEAWKMCVVWAHQDRADGIAPSTRTYCCLLRRQHMSIRLGLKRCSKSVLVNDHLSADMARYLNRLYPKLKCPTRAAASDGWAALGGEAS